MNSVLIIDDEIEIVTLLSRFFKKQNFEVLSSYSLIEGKEIYKNTKPKLLVLDINLNDGNGLDELPFFKTENEHCKIVMMSALDSDTTKSQALNNGAVAFLSKPFNALSMLQIIHQHKMDTPN